MAAATRTVAALAAAAVTASTLHGCGGGGGGGGGGGDKPSTKTTTVLIMRHCARSTGESGIYDTSNLEYFNNYSETPWPDFGVPDMYCLERGVDIVQQEGEWLREHGNLPAPVFVIADDVERDHVTGQALLKGLQLDIDNSTYSVDAAPFGDASGKKDGCPKISNDDVKKGVEDQQKLFPEPSWFSALHTKLFEVAGVGKAGDWTGSPCAVMPDFADHWWAPLSGSCDVANNFAERFLMEEGGGFPVGWGKMNHTDVVGTLELHSWYMQVALNAPAIQKTRAASMAWAVLEALEAKNEGTTAFVGHDTNQAGLNAVLGLGWKPTPWPENSTMPGSALRFDLEEGSDTVKVSYVYVKDFSAGGGLETVPASVGGFDDGTVSLSGLRQLVEENTNQACRLDKKDADADLEESANEPIATHGIVV